MNNETLAGSSPAEVEDVFRGEPVSFDEFSKYRQSGELPERFKPAEPAESAPADAPEETAEPEGESPEPAPESDPEEAQEPPQKGSAAERRIKQLLAQNKELQRKLESAGKQDGKPESSPAKPAATQYTRSKPTAEDKDASGSPKYSTYEDFVEDLADWKAEQRIATAERERIERARAESFQAKLAEARQRYGDTFDDTVAPAAMAIDLDANVPSTVKQMLEESEHLSDLLFTLGSDPAEMQKFIQMAKASPGKAFRYIAALEAGIAEELGKADTARNDKGQFVAKEKAPEPKTTKAPKPPSPVSGASSRAFDVSDESLSPEEWARKRTADLQKRGR